MYSNEIEKQISECYKKCYIRVVAMLKNAPSNKIEFDDKKKYVFTDYGSNKTIFHDVLKSVKLYNGHLIVSDRNGCNYNYETECTPDTALIVLKAIEESDFFFSERKLYATIMGMVIGYDLKVDTNIDESSLEKTILNHAVIIFNDIIIELENKYPHLLCECDTAELVPYFGDIKDEMISYISDEIKRYNKIIPTL